MILRPYQKQACVNVARKLHDLRSVLLVAPTGSGKTVMGSALIANRVKKGERVLFCAHRRELIQQSASALRRSSVGAHSVGVIAPGAQSTPSLPVQVASIQTLLSRGFPERVDFVVLDECVTGYTMIGGKPACETHVGDLVDSHLGKDPVTHVFMRQHFGGMVRLRIGESMLECTDNHPVWTERRGYVQAKSVVRGDLCCVRKVVRYGVGERAKEGNMFAGVSLLDMLEGNGSNQSQVCVGSNEGTKPHEATRDKRESERNATPDRTLPTGSQGQRNRTDSSGNRSSESHGDENERNCSNWFFSWGKRISDALQGGRRILGAKDRDRSRRKLSRNDYAESSRQKERAFLTLARVDSVEMFQPPSPGGITVYNFEVQGSHTYFANGILTHNCHHYPADDWGTIHTYYPNAKFVGLTATPERGDGRPLGDMFEDLVVAAQYSELLRDGYLVPCDVYQPERGMGSNEVAQDPLLAYQSLAPGQRCFIFASRVEQCEILATRFSDAGIPARVIEANSPKPERDAHLRDFRADRVKVLVNVYALTEGVDVPEASCVIIARKMNHVSMYLQTCGRVLRPAPGKTKATIIDLSGATLLHGFPTEDREYSLEGDAIRRTSAEPLRVCPACGATSAAWRSSCPECGFVPPIVEAPKLKIFSQELRKVFAGMKTPASSKREEYLRLREQGRQRGWALYSVQKEYAKLFGEKPIIDDATPEEKRESLERWRAECSEKGWKPGRAAVMHKQMFGEWP